MIPEGDPIYPGMNVLHDEGLLYQVENVRQSTTGYETDHELGGLVVNYTQLEQGKFPPGHKWSKDEAGFRTYFTAAGTSVVTRDEFRSNWGSTANYSWTNLG